jgi:hypothetical protein
MNLTRVPASARSMSRFRACCTTHAWAGCSVAPQDPDAAGTVLDHGKDVHLGAVEEVGGEEVQGQDPLCL